MSSRAPTTFSSELFHVQLITFIALEKCEKECNKLEIILVQGFCPLKMDFILILLIIYLHID